MKKAILTIVIAASFAACNNSKPVEQSSMVQSVSTPDTNGLAQFKQWKEKQELINSPEAFGADQNIITEPIEETSEPVTKIISRPATKVIYRTIPSKEERVAKITKPAPRGAESNGVRTSRSRTSNPEASPVENESTAGTQSGTGDGAGVSNGDVVSAPAEVEKPKNEGWSKAAKGTAVGAGSGAVLGAIISKNKGKGAVIGGIIGAAGGYVLGRKQDKKDGRY